MRIAIRMDDITPGMDWEKFGRIKDLLDEADVLPLIGVVPDCRDPKLAIDPERTDFWSYVKELQEKGWTIAMHGLHHVYTTKDGGLFPLNRQSEYASLPLEAQTSMIREGKQILAGHGIYTDLFMAPAHAYDENTLQALLANGFTRMTDGYGRSPYRYRGMTFYPISFDRGRCLKDTSDDPTTFVIHPNTMTEGELSFYRDLFRRGNLLNYRDYLSMKPVERTAAGAFLEHLQALSKRTLVQVMAKQ